MGNWDTEELARIASTDDLHVAPLRDDARTYGTPTWIWSVVVDGELYARAYNGTDSRWYRAAMRQRAGRISTGGKTFDVGFEPVGAEIGKRVDEAYHAKYGGNPYLSSMVGTRARSATVRIVPASGNGAQGQRRLADT